MSSVLDERTALEAVLQAAMPDINCYRYWPNNVQAPAVLVKPASYDRESQSGGWVRRYDIEVLVAVQDNEEAQVLVDQFIEDEGAYSIREILEDDPTLGGKVDMCIYDGWSQYNGRRTEVQVYLGVIFHVEIWTT